MSHRVKAYVIVLLALAASELLVLYFIGDSLMAHAEKIMGCKL